MKDTKIEFKLFTVPQWKKEEKYLREQHNNGWEYLQNYVGYSYFRKPAAEMDGTEEEIFCDDASRLDMMKRVFVARMLPLFAIFFLVIIPQIIMQSQFNTAFNRGLMVFLCVLSVLYLALFAAFAIPFWRYYKSIHKKY